MCKSPSFYVSLVFVLFIVGITVPWIITALTGMPTIVPLYSIVLSLRISVSVGIVSSLYPATRSSRLDPIQALRHE